MPDHHRVRPPGHADAPWRAQPVFVDRTDRRRHLTVLVGTVLGAALVGALILLLLGLVGGSPQPATDGPYDGRRAVTGFGPPAPPPAASTWVMPPSRTARG